MAKITIDKDVIASNLVLDTSVFDVTIEKAYLGVRFISDNGEEIYVCNRDGGFEVGYYPDGDAEQERVFLHLGKVKLLHGNEDS